VRNASAKQEFWSTDPDLGNFDSIPIFAESDAAHDQSPYCLPEFLQLE
jgi:hypothetical protein